MVYTYLHSQLQGDLSGQTVSTKNASHGLVVMGGDSCSKGRGFESRHHIVYGHSFTLICFKNYNDFCLKRPKINNKRVRGWPIF